MLMSTPSASNAAVFFDLVSISARVCLRDVSSQLLMEQYMKFDDVFNMMKEMMSEAPLTIPPESFKEMKAEIVEYVENQSIEVRIPLFEKYNNPAGLILGGYLPVFFDLSFGPLSFLVAKKPTTSLDLNTTFIRPVTAKDKYITIKSSVISKSKSYLILDAQAYNLKNDLVATATSRLQILS